MSTLVPYHLAHGLLDVVELLSHIDPTSAAAHLQEASNINNYLGAPALIRRLQRSSIQSDGTVPV
ncbi:hypothetical protein [uncultured Jatrophihabitans sp.]|uniref:hypothetical protein n=1 Tax=uncultured Jatrophihabitans sp. TaxID=1610747 RepID=UPI0035CC9F82